MNATKIAMLRAAVKSYNPSREEARALFDKVEMKQKEYSDKVKASIPTKLDRQRVYNL